MARYSFELPTALSATAPPEARGLRRDEVRLLVASKGGIDHARFHDLTRFLDPGDLIVVNTSATLPAAVDGTLGGQAIGVHFSAPLDDGSWVVELRTADGSGPLRKTRTGARVELTGGGRLEVLSAYAGIEGRSRMVRVRAETPTQVEAYLR
ncbi:MAG: S-adenosylmethionine:tRNA ribosyltransferase-isomerase, partial [Actinobacteria bacterium]|nr:S-adenosylmethionine:tRNA ribosyltransferase-isomerase [Actinomycetota bacterium]